MPLEAQVAISDATLLYDKLYSYVVPASLEGLIFVGSIVLIPFGRGRTIPRIGVVVHLEEKTAVPPRIKELMDVAPEGACLTEELLAIVDYLRQATFCTWYDAVKAVIPHGAQYKAVYRDEHWTLESKIRRHTQAVYQLADEAGNEANPVDPGSLKKITAKQQLVLDCLKAGIKSREEILQECGAGKSVLDTLVKQGRVIKTERDKNLVVQALAQEEGNHPRRLVGGANGESISLSPLQEKVATVLKQRMEEHSSKPALLYGVTGSGKTAVFLELARKALENGKTALMLVPEIGLTPQMIAHFQGVFGDEVAVQHSGLSSTERLLQWRAIGRGEARVVVGTRSAVFAPLDNIGIIIVDEEQERTYQSESPPRYDAIEVAKRRAARHSALLLLASATPSVASYYAAKTGRYELLQLKERYGNIPLPLVDMVDMQAELLAGNTNIISRQLAIGIEETIQAGNQVILLLNRRGYHRVGVCRSCGEVLKCTDCSVPMVYHRSAKKGGKTTPLENAVAEEMQVSQPTGEEYLLCHYCGRSLRPVPEVCPECGGPIRYAGFGTQRMEEELEERFPHARVLRMDMDSTSRKGSHSDMLGAFARGEYDIMLGTQMVAKGLDFEKVSLVGVVGIDSLLFSQGYRAFEQVFSLVTQVVGRSGRSGSQGRALIQTVDPDNPVLTLAAKQDYDAFYKQEIAFRKMALYPPYCTLCIIGFVSKVEGDVLQASRRFSVLLAGLAGGKPDIPLRILGPAPMNVVQVAGAYRYRLTLKCRNDVAFRNLVLDVLNAYNKEGLHKKASVYIDFHSDGGG